jgi:single-strand DNA-binding protein
MRTTPQGLNVANFSVATNTKFGNGQDQVEYHNIVVWRKLADIAVQYLKKGSQVYIEGRIQSRSWQGNDGVKKNRTEIIANNMIMLGRPTGAGQSSAGNSAGESDFSIPEEAPAQDSNQAEGGDEEITVEDIPF